MPSIVPLSPPVGRFFSSRIVVLTVLSAILVTLLGVFALKSLATLNRGTEWVVHAQRVRYELSRIMQLLVDMGGGGVRRFTLTHDENSFQESNAAAAALPASLEELHHSLADDPQPKALEAQLLDAVRARREQVDQSVAMAHAGDVAGLTAMTERGDSTRLLDACRDVITRMQDEESKVFEQHRTATAAARSTVAFAIAATTMIAVVLLAAVAYVSLRHSAAVRRAQNELTTTLRSIGDAVISTDANGAVRFMNPVAEELTGWAERDAYARPLDEVFCIVNEHTRLKVESPVSRVLRNRAVVGLANHTVLIAKNAGERTIEDSGAPILDGNGELTGVVLVFRDATSQREAQQALVQSAAALREADQRKDVFLATLSHELRNPLAPIRNAARLLESPTLSSEDLRRSRQIISRQVKHMASLLEDLLDISRITRGMLKVRKEIIVLKRLFEAAVETAQPGIEAKRHELVVRWPPEDLHVSADPLRLTQVITNLLANAAKYTDPEGKIVLSSSLDGTMVIICVSDTGIGMEPHMLDKVFEMFSQAAPDSGGMGDSGLGIGLALVKGLVELHGGRVSAASGGLEQGSEFTIFLPDAVAASPELAAVAHEPGPPPNDRPLRILVADDNHDSAESLAMLLELSGYEVCLAHDGLEALALAAERRPEVALLDIGMPGMNGYEVAASLRRESWGAGMLLIAITGWGQDEVKRLARDAGFDHHLTKPMDTAILEGLLSAVRRT